MTKVLIVGDLFGRDLAANHYMIMPKLFHGFVRAGCAVCAFNDREAARNSTPLGTSVLGRRAANRQLLLTCRNFRPDLVLLGHCELITNQTLSRLKADYPDLRIAYRNVDSLDNGPNLKRIRHRASTVDSIFVTTANPLPTKGGPDAPSYYIPNPVDHAIDLGRCFEHDDQEHDLFFALGAGNLDSPRADLAQDIAARAPSLRFDLRGVGAKPAIRGAAYLDALTNARMGLSLSAHNKHYLYASDRMSQYMGNGLLTFVHRSTGFGDLFAEDQIVLFDDRTELLEKLYYFKNNDRERRRNAERGWRAAHSMFASERIAKYIIERSFNRPLSESYPWPTTTSTRIATQHQLLDSVAS